MRRAQLPWYDFDFLRDTHQRFWDGVRSRMPKRDSLPLKIDRTSELDSVLLDSGLLLSQTCGYDLAVRMPVPLQMVYTPVYLAPGCGYGTYRSFLVVRADSAVVSDDDLSGLRFIANDERSWSGYHCVRERWDEFAGIQFSGGHSLSLLCLSEGDADLAAIDCVAWELLRLNEPEALSGFRVIGATSEVPAPPLVTRMLSSVEEFGDLRRALSETLASDESFKRDLLIDRFVMFDLEDYEFMNPANSSTDPSPGDYVEWLL